MILCINILDFKPTNSINYNKWSRIIHISTKRKNLHLNETWEINSSKFKMFIKIFPNIYIPIRNINNFIYII